MPGLVYLPTEVIRMICGQLVPDVIPTGGKYKNRRPGYKLCQRDLWSLTLVSQRIGGIATEYLYRHVAMWSTKQMVCLFRTICEKPDIRRYPRYLANMVPLMASVLQRRMKQDIQIYYPLLSKSTTDLPQIYPRELTLLDSPELLSAEPLLTHQIIRHMLVLLPRLKDILTTILGTPIDEPPRYTEDADTAFPPFSGEPRTLRIQWHYSYDHHADDPERWGSVFQLYFTPYYLHGCCVTDLRFLHLAIITSYEIRGSLFYGLDAVFGPNRFVRSEKNRGFLSWLAQLKTLDLGSSSVNPHKVSQLLAACQNLTKLTWNSYYGDEYDDPGPCDSAYVDSTFQPLAGQLEELYLSMSALRGIVSFRHFRALRVLSVNYEVITSEELHLGKPLLLMKTPLVSLLPESLVHLEILSTEGFRYTDTMGGYVAHDRQLLPNWLVDGLEVFSRSCPAMPNFRSITVVQPLSDYLLRDHPVEVEVGDLTAAFDAVSVQFSAKISRLEY